VTSSLTTLDTSRSTYESTLVRVIKPRGINSGVHICRSAWVNYTLSVQNIRNTCSFHDRLTR
jgi:hypothetical protein